jgi:hypothetical protein
MAELAVIFKLAQHSKDVVNEQPLTDEVQAYTKEEYVEFVASKNLANRLSR